MSTLESLTGRLIDRLRKRLSRKPTLNIRNYGQSDRREPHHFIIVALKNNDEAHDITFESISVKPKSLLWLKVVPENPIGSGIYGESRLSFSKSVQAAVVVPSGLERYFQILFSTKGLKPATNDSLFLKMSSSRPGSFQKMTKPIMLTIAVDANMRARIQ